LENLDDDVDINRAWETIRENIKTSAKVRLGYYELKKHKPWLDEGCSKLLDQRIHAKWQWLPDPSEINGYNLNIIRREASRHFCCNFILPPEVQSQSQSHITNDDLSVSVSWFRAPSWAHDQILITV
jgi:hypothetical protein